MLQIREILCPTDFSDASRHALEHAMVIARWYDARLTAVNVIHMAVLPPIMAASYADVPLPPVPTYEEQEATLRAWLEPAERGGVRTRRLVTEGAAAHVILDEARSLHADLIVMGTHGLGGFERFMLGSVTEKVLRRAVCPVLTVPPAMQTAAKVPYTRMLCAVDVSDPSLAALTTAFAFAQEADAALTIVHVFDWPADEDLLVERFDAGEFHRVVEEQTRQRLEALIPADVRVWCTPRVTLAYGKPYREIVEIAAREQADLIVMGVHGRNPLNLALFGSTTNQVVRHAPCPVLTLRG